MNLEELLNSTDNLAVFDSLIVANNKINNSCYKSIACSVSGGSDSDVMLDLLHQVDKDNKVRYVFFNTGLEYQATKDHLKYLEDKYGITIEVINAKKPIPITCREIGQPFLNKFTSKMIWRLQKHNFNWVDEPFEILYKKYPNCKSALSWWCNKNGGDTGATYFNISNNKWLKEFMLANPPTFKISDMCCEWAKKKPVHEFIKVNKINLNCYGVRKSEGGIRSTSYKNCFSDGSEKGKVDEYRPIFWYKDDDKKSYEKSFGVTHSKCYTKYGFKRTGCAGCPFNRNFEEDLKVIEKYEPKLFKAVNNIFGDSYEYTRMYKEFVKEMKERERNKNTARNN